MIIYESIVIFIQVSNSIPQNPTAICLQDTFYLFQKVVFRLKCIKQHFMVLSVEKQNNLIFPMYKSKACRKKTATQAGRLQVYTMTPLPFYVAPLLPQTPEYRITFTSSSLYCVILAHRYSSLCNRASELLHFYVKLYINTLGLFKHRETTAAYLDYLMLHKGNSLTSDKFSDEYCKRVLPRTAPR